MSNAEDTMTVAELVSVLIELDPDLPVRTQGCDCDGEAASVEVVAGELYIRRDLYGTTCPRLSAEASATRKRAEELRKAQAEAKEAALEASRAFLKREGFIQ